MAIAEALPELMNKSYTPHRLHKRALVGQRWLVKPAAGGPLKLADLVQPGKDARLLSMVRNAEKASRLKLPGSAVGILETGSTKDKDYYQVLDLGQPSVALADTMPLSKFSEQQALELTSDLLAAASSFHDQGMVHSAISPYTIYQEGHRLKLGELWWVHKTNGEPPHEPLAEHIPDGLPPRCMVFAAPEFMLFGKPSERSDIYSIGATVFFMLTGKPPRELPTMGNGAIYDPQLIAVSTEMHLADLRPDLSEEAVAIVTSMLAADADSRATRHDLEAFLSRRLAYRSASTGDTIQAPEGFACPTALSGALDFRHQQAVYVTAQAYRDRPLDAQELTAVAQHLKSWRSVLANNGIFYDGIPLDGRCEHLPGAVYHLVIPVDTRRYPAALSLITQALYDLEISIPTAQWEVHAIEQVVTPLTPNVEIEQMVGGQRKFPLRVAGRPARGESAEAAHD